MKPQLLSISQARKIILYAAGLANRSRFGNGPGAALKVIEHLGFVQVDTNFVVERAHHHTIFSRVADYDPAWLRDLQADGLVYEFWTRDSGFMPMSEFRYSLPIQASFAGKWQTLSAGEQNLMDRILDRIGREGPLGAKDFDNDRTEKSTGWWDWRPSKVALERLHLTGQLLTIRKKDFHKLYDLTSNIITPDTDRTMPNIEEFSRHLILRSLRSMGIAYLKEISWNGRFVKHTVKDVIKDLLKTGEVIEVQIHGLKGPLYTTPTYLKKRITVSGDAFILSPFDPLNVFRHRLRDFFGFEYQLECFVPGPKRKYGYFSLPVLIGDVFVARIDAKAERKRKTLVINNIHFEKVVMTAAMINKLCKAINAFTKFNRCVEIEIMKSNNKALLKQIRGIIKS